jgi:hypothetical protein
LINLPIYVIIDIKREIFFMKYDVDDIALRVEAAKRNFKITLAVCATLIVASIFVAFYFTETTVVFVCTAIALASFGYFMRFIKKKNPVIVFSKGFSGVNVKEHEYVTAGTRLTRYGGISYRYIPSRHKGDVYVRCDGGKIVAVTHLPKKHLDIYEIGDELVVYPGTRFPNVCGRDVSEQPCPICGYVNSKSEECCESCGLKVAKM